MSTTVQMPMTRGFFALVDEEDAGPVLAHRWWPSPARRPAGLVYAYTQIGGHTVYLHRFILGLSDGPGAVQGEHANGDGLDCRRENLRVATQTMNNANAAFPIGISGYRGVHPTGRGRWRACIQVHGRVTRRGPFSTAEAAAIAYDALARVAFGTFATLNFPFDGERRA